ncbi:glycoside hydrolase family 30 protein [Mucisphaera calidilacus]|nr:glycoside hydrolase family 30 protein [Mucisphaera calidilacus]
MKTDTAADVTSVNIYETSRATGESLRPAGSVAPETGAVQGLIRITLDASKRYQTIIGFGGALTESSAVNYQMMNEGMRETFLRGYFSTEGGHGYAFWRTHIHACDFSRGRYTYVDEGDVSLKSFSLDADRNTVLPLIKDAMAVADRPVSILASPWSPPAWMKSNGDMLRGGKLLPEHRQTWADYFVRYIESMGEEGIPIWGVTVQNEPDATQTWESCRYSAEEERDFVRDYLGPTLERAGLGDVRIVIWDHNRDLLLDRATIAYQDAEASQYIWGAGFHWYCGDFFENVQRLHDAYPEKHLIFTEGCQEGGPHTGAWELGERYGRSIINDLNRWCEGWLDWNILLDETGGPNHVGNLCSAPILYDRNTGQMLYQSSYAYLGHFSRFIEPGAVRIGCDVSHADLLATACENPDGSLAVVVMNHGEYDLDYTLEWMGRSYEITAPARGIQTLVTGLS